MNISALTKEAMAAARDRGVKLGGPRGVPEDVVRSMAADREAALTFRAIAQRLSNENVPTAQGGVWRPATVRKVLLSRAAD